MPSPRSETAAGPRIEEILREDGGRLLAVLIGSLRSFERAEEALQDAVVSALEHWDKRGLPHNPRGWLLQVARRKAIDRLRRDSNFRAKQDEIERLMQLDMEPSQDEDESGIPDERLKLIFTCCHPALERQASVALTLRTLCGLSTEEIAHAFLVSRETMAQRIVRAQQKIAKARIPYEVPWPEQLAERLDAVFAVIYLVFNEGYASGTKAYVRVDLCEEAIRMARILRSLLPENEEAQGLLALLLLHHSRSAARLNAAGEIVPLEEQDRESWNRDMIGEGTSLIGQALRRERPGPYQLQASIAAIHCEAASFADTGWREIGLIYERLYDMQPNPVIVLNRIVALSYEKGAEAALQELQSLESELKDYQPYNAACADLLARSGHHAAALAAYDIAISQSANEPSKLFLIRKQKVLAEAMEPAATSRI